MLDARRDRATGGQGRGKPRGPLMPDSRPPSAESTGQNPGHGPSFRLADSGTAGAPLSPLFKLYQIAV
jgi:hypothetical protein